ncbi:hypothetical protein D9757_010924 [Collybiopsis confluens]|uniref:Uncharacterized protein n=1 Tax=Collybiopsis confluens TaxID=2823264 RepID=A0A8H5FRU1_9AGAR|nr:hypothetical protein D9757_014704 [Collybiopsis confluens]KAF5365563.1 hypothetical protein D9757_010924 [Collybiopsis confluens]
MAMAEHRSLMAGLPKGFDFNKGASQYVIFIKQIRANLPARTSVRDVPILNAIPQGQNPQYFDLDLTAGVGSDVRVVRVRLQMNNLYVVGYSRDRGATWYELAHDDEKSDTLQTVTTKVSKF